MYCRIVKVVKAHGKCRIVACDTGSRPWPTLAINNSDVCISTIFPKSEFCPFLHQFTPKMLKSGTVQTGLSLGQNSTCSCLNTCLWLLSHNSQVLNHAIQNSWIKRNFGVFVDSSSVLAEMKQICSLYPYLIIKIWLKSQISLSAFPVSALQCLQPQCQPNFVRNR